MRIWRNGFVLLGAALVAGLLGGCNQNQGDVIAKVNGETITTKEFFEYMKAKPQVQVVLPNGQPATADVADTIAFQVLQDLVRQKVIVQLAKDAKLEPTTAEIQAEVEFQRKRESNFVNNLKERGLTLDQIRDSLRVDLSREKLLTHDVKVTDAEVAEFIKNNRASFTAPEMFIGKWILVTSEQRKREVDRDLLAGSSFVTVARRLSEDPNLKEYLGDYRQSPTQAQNVLSLMPEPIQVAIRATAEGKETAWINLSDGWAKFYIDDKIESKYMEPDDADKQWIKRQLAVQKGLQSKDIDRRMLDKLKKSDITVVSQELQRPWEELLKKLEDVSSTGTPTDQSKKPESAGGAGN